MLDPSRENSTCAENSVLQSGELEPLGTISQTAAVKVKRSGEGEDGMEFWPLEIEWPGGLIGGEEALFIAATTLHVAPHRGGERG